MRNTYDTKVPLVKGVNPSQDSKQRQTYTVNNPKQLSYQKQGNNANISNNQKMSRFIIETMKKLPLNNDKYVTVTTIKTNQKSLFNTISNLLWSLDYAFQESQLSVQILPQIFSTLGYPQLINKTFFQPVGAPHTWSQCLMMMQWLAQLAAFHFDIKSHLEEGEFESDILSLLVKAHIQQTPMLPQKFIQNKINQKNRLIEEHSFAAKTLAMSIQNLKLSQRDLSQMQQQLKSSQSTLNRQNQQVIQAQHQNSQIIKLTQEQDRLIQNEEILTQDYQKQKQILNYEINNQQLSVEQVQKITIMIQECQNKIIETKRFQSEQRQDIKKFQQKMIQDFLQLSKSSQRVRNLSKVNRFQLQRRNLYISIPDLQVSQFMDYLTQEDSQGQQQVNQSQMEQLLSSQTISDIIAKADKLLQQIQGQLNSIQQHNKKGSEQIRQLDQGCLQVQQQTREERRVLQGLKEGQEKVDKEIYDSEVGNTFGQKEVEQIERQLQQQQAAQTDLLAITDQLISQIKEALTFKKTYQAKVTQSISTKERLLEESQIQALLSMEEYYNSVIELNQYVDQVQYVQDMFSRGDQGRESVQRRHTKNIAPNTDNQDQFTIDQQQQTLQIPRSLYEQITEETDYENKGCFTSPPNQRVNRMNNRGIRK